MSSAVIEKATVTTTVQKPTTINLAFLISVTMSEGHSQQDRPYKRIRWSWIILSMHAVYKMIAQCSLDANPGQKPSTMPTIPR
jgi:hypothetical protein